jgi:hypothetical protein
MQKSTHQQQQQQQSTCCVTFCRTHLYKLLYIVKCLLSKLMMSNDESKGLQIRTPDATAVSLLQLQHPTCKPQPQSVAFLLDYAGPDGFPQQLAQHVAAVVVLDHHKTAAAQLADSASHPPNLHVHLDMQCSGAAIARDYFAPPGLSEQLQQMFR